MNITGSNITIIKKSCKKRDFHVISAISRSPNEQE